MNDILGTAYVLIALGAIIIIRHGVPHALRCWRERKDNPRSAQVAILLTGLMLFAIGEGFVTGWFSGSRFWERPDWMVLSNIPGVVRSAFSPLGIWLVYFALYGKTWRTLRIDGAIVAVCLAGWYAAFHI